MVNEIQINPDLLSTSIEWYVKSSKPTDKKTIGIILQNKFGATFRKIIRELFFKKFDEKFSFRLGSTIGEIFVTDFNNPETSNSILDHINAELKSDSKEKNCTAIFAMMSYVFNLKTHSSINSVPKDKLKPIYDKMLELIKMNDNHLNFSIAWCVAWSGERLIIPNELINEFCLNLTNPWMNSEGTDMKRALSWALSTILNPSLKKNEFEKFDNLNKVINYNYSNPKNEFDKIAAACLGIIIGEENINSKEFAELVKNKVKRIPFKKTNLNEL